MSATEPPLTPASVRAAAALAGLPLSVDRADAVTDVLNEWLPGSHALNARMRAAELDEVMPVTPFAAPQTNRTGPADD